MLALIVAAAVTGGCFQTVQGSGKLLKESYDLGEFSRVTAGSGFGLEVVRADSFSVEIDIDDNLLEYLQIGVENGGLEIRMQSGRSYRPGQGGMRARIGMPVLAGLSLSGGAEARIQGFSSDGAVELVGSGGSVLRGVLRAGALSVSLSGGSRLELKGTAKRLALLGSGGSKLDLAALPVEDAQVGLSGGSEGVVHVTGKLAANLSGGAELAYMGEPEITRLQTSGGASIDRR